MKLSSLWFKLLKGIHCPVLVPLDIQHEATVTDEILQNYYSQLPHKKYVPEIHDCDNYAFEFKGIADRDSNAIGLVFGWMHGLHAWNCAITDNGIVQIEPQNGEIFKSKKEYHPILVLI